MTTNMYRKLGLAAVILLAPGGFILGATLAANHLRKRLRHAPDEPADMATNEAADDGAGPGRAPPAECARPDHAATGGAAS